MDAPLEPRRRVIREEVAYEPIPQVVPQPVVAKPVVGVQPVVQQVVAQPVVPAQPVVGFQPGVVAAQPVVSAQPLVSAQPVVGVNPATGLPFSQTVLPQPIVGQPVVAAQSVIAAQPVVQAQPYVAVEPAPAVDTQRSYSQVGDMRVENVRQGFYDANGNLVEREEQIFDDPYVRRMNRLDRIGRIVYFVMGFLEVLLALRFLFRVIGADPNNGFARFIYNLTGAFVGPFNGIFNDQTLSSGSVVEISTLLAMAIYALLTYGVIQLMYLLFTPNRSSRSVFSSTRRRGL